jgi:NAD(P)-dependent dehydrogenase (short-subunit alcohol dehydrogenase family)
LVSHRQRERFGPNIAEAVLESGDRLVATARDTKRLDDLVKKYGDRVRAVPLDVTDESAAQAAVQTAVAAFGRLDVVVNNAGYGDIAPFEQLSAEVQGSDGYQLLRCG